MDKRIGVSTFCLYAIRRLVLALFLLTWTAVAQSNDSYKHCFHVNNTSNLDTALQNALDLQHNSSVEISLAAGNFNLTSNHLTTFYHWNKLAIVGESRENTSIHCNDDVGLAFFNSVDVVIRNLNIYDCGTEQNSTSRAHSNGSYASDEQYLKFPVGLYFLACTNITMEGVRISSSSSDTPTGTGTGTGVVIYNTRGNNTFSDCEFSNNQVPTNETCGGGGVVIEFSYCVPGDVTCNNSVSRVQVINSTYMFRKCDFNNNVVYTPPWLHEPLYPHGTEHIAFGKGGGLAIHFKGRSKGNKILLEDCNIESNAATLSGGGLYLGFGDQSSENSVYMQGENSMIQWNGSPPGITTCTDVSHCSSSSGGGARIEYIHYPPQMWSGYESKVTNNRVVFNQTKFFGNIAYVGGAVSVVVPREKSGEEATNSLVFNACHFRLNMAFVGFAVDLSLHHTDVVTASGAVMEPVFKDCEIKFGQQKILDPKHYSDSLGALYANKVPVKFEGITNFTENSGSAMVVSDTYISLMNSSKMFFTDNTGRRGGAIAFIGNAWLVAYENTELEFDGNSVGMDGLGGAIYAVHFGEHDVLNERSCFFRYYKYLEDPSTWNTILRFRRNKSKHKANSIYVSSVLPCARPKPNQTEIIVSETFCDLPWVFEDVNGTCSSQIVTGPNSMAVSEKSLKLELVPGWKKDIGISVSNDYNLPVQAVFRAVQYQSPDPYGTETSSLHSKSFDFGVSNETEYIADNMVKVYGKPNVPKVSILFTTLDPRVISSVKPIVIKPCPPGFRAVYCTDKPRSHMICDCKCANPGVGLKCDDQVHTALLHQYFCLTHSYHDNDTVDNSSLIYQKCPYNSKPIVNVSNSSVGLENAVCGPLKRTGILCSKCEDEYGVDVNSYHFRCIKCHIQTGWLVYLALEILPITLFFMLIAILHISATSAAMNAFVFFSQIVSIPYFQNPYPFFHSPIFLNSKWLQAGVLTPYGIWNLDFFRSAIFPGICLSPHIGTLEALALNYVKALYPMLLIVVCYVLIRLYDYNFRVVHWMWKPFRWCLKRLHKHHQPKTSIIDAFATFLLLSYTKFMFVTVPLLSPHSLYNGSSEKPMSLHKTVFFFDASAEFHGKYLALVIVAAVLFVILVVLPPLFLITYPMRMFQRCFGRLPFRIVIKTFADAFQGDFRDGVEQGMDCRCFAGLYFLFRIGIFTIFVLPLQNNLAAQYLIQQIFFNFIIVLFTMVKPYRVEFYNKLDISFFFLLSLMNAFSFYSSQMDVDGEEASHAYGVFVVNYILGLLPLLYIIGLASYLILMWMGCVKKRVESKPSESIVIIGEPGYDEDSDKPFTYTYNAHQSEEDIPDRLLNPQNYASRNLYRPLNANGSSKDSTSGSNSQASNKGIVSEGSYFLNKQGKRDVPAYGSTSATEPNMRMRSQHNQLKSIPDEI